MDDGPRRRRVIQTVASTARRKSPRQPRHPLGDRDEPRRALSVVRRGRRAHLAAFAEVPAAHRAQPGIGGQAHGRARPLLRAGRSGSRGDAARVPVRTIRAPPGRPNSRGRSIRHRRIQSRPDAWGSTSDVARLRSSSSELGCRTSARALLRSRLYPFAQNWGVALESECASVPFPACHARNA